MDQVEIFEICLLYFYVFWSINTQQKSGMATTGILNTDLFVQTRSGSNRTSRIRLRLDPDPHLEWGGTGSYFTNQLQPTMERKQFIFFSVHTAWIINVRAFWNRVHNNFSTWKTLKFVFHQKQVLWGTKQWRFAFDTNALQLFLGRSVILYFKI